KIADTSVRVGSALEQSYQTEISRIGIELREAVRQQGLGLAGPSGSETTPRSLPRVTRTDAFSSGVQAATRVVALFLPAVGAPTIAIPVIGVAGSASPKDRAKNHRDPKKGPKTSPGHDRNIDTTQGAAKDGSVDDTVRSQSSKSDRTEQLITTKAS
ncbi:MAG: hypothetical protein ABR507_12665, partial [Actinomycetota bacterium]